MPGSELRNMTTCELRKKVEGCIKGLDPAKEDLGYLPGYVRLLSWFEKQECWDDCNTTVAAHAAYAWMPKILRTISPHAADVLNAETPPECEQGFRLLNNSLVGTSKLLHLRFPDQIPIWDSRIASSFGLNFDNYRHFQSYVKNMQDLSRDKKLSDEIKIHMRSLMKSKISNIDLLSFSDIRQLELVLFWSTK
jgi:hypothetical protein